MCKKIILIGVFLTCISYANETPESQYGVSLLTPGVLNFVMKGINDLPLQLTVGISPGAEVGYNFYYNKNSPFRSVQIVFGSSRIKNNEWHYGGISGTFLWGGFYFETGLSAGRRDYATPLLLFMIGYLW